MSTSKEERDLCMYFITSLTLFLKEELIDKFPNENFINNSKQKFKINNIDNEHDAATVLSDEIIKEMNKSRKDKDLFIEKLMKSQLFLTYLFDVIKF